MTKQTADLRRGSAILELALSIPLLSILLVGAMDFSRLFYMSVTLASAARAGAQYALSVSPPDMAAVQTVAVSAASDLSGSSSSNSSARLPRCSATVVIPSRWVLDRSWLPPIFPALHQCAPEQTTRPTASSLGFAAIRTF